MKSKEEMSKKNKSEKVKINKRVLLIVCIVGIMLFIGLVFAICKWQKAEAEYSKLLETERIKKSIYTDMTSKEMYEATRNLATTEKQGLVEMFIMKWKQDKRNNVDRIGDNETHARYLFCN